MTDMPNTTDTATELNNSSSRAVIAYDVSSQTCALVFFVVFGTVENMLLSCAVVCTPRLRCRVAYVIMCKVVLLDLSHAALIQPLALASAVFRRWPFDMPSCHAFAWLAVGLALDYTHTLLTFLVDRLLAAGLCPALHIRCTGQQRTKALLAVSGTNVLVSAASWAMAAIVFTHSFSFAFDSVRLMCLPFMPTTLQPVFSTWSVSRRVYVALSTSVLVCGCALVVGMSMWRERSLCCGESQAAQHSLSSSSSALVAANQLRQRRRLWRQVNCFAAAVVVHVVFNVPFVWALFYDVSGQGVGLAVLTMWLMYARPSLMPIAFVLADSNLRRAVFKLLGKITPFTFGQPVLVSRRSTADSKALLMAKLAGDMQSKAAPWAHKSFSAGSLELNMLRPDDTAMRRLSAPAMFTV